ncbi:unnamed protein product [Rotaria sp. Silwood2]|nr:unnamed protein product [Rotaria sp. Silwood2]
MFSIKILSTIECLSCFNIFTKEELTYMLSIEINNINYLNKALEHFINPEIMTGENAYFCPRCEHLVTAKKQLILDELSPVLILNLKRSIMLDDTTEKLSHHVRYNELLDFSPYTTHRQFDSNKENNESDNVSYKLYGVVNHYGDSLECGHYWSYIRTSDDNWFIADDAYCRRVPLNEVFDNPNAYVLFYVKASCEVTKSSTASQQQPLQSSLTENKILFQPLSTFDRSTISNTSSRSAQSIIFQDEKSSDEKLSSETEKTAITKKNEYQHELKSKLNNRLCDFDENNVDSGEKPIEERTESTITICNEFPNKLSKEQTIHIGRIFSNDVTKSLATVASGVPIDEVFEATLPQLYDFRLNPNQLIKMSQIRKEEYKKIGDRKMKLLGLMDDSSSTSLKKKLLKNTSALVSTNQISNDMYNRKKNDSTITAKVNIEYLHILLPHLKRYNATCALCISTRYFGKNMSRSSGLLVRCTLKCSGKVCKFKCTVRVMNNGYCFLIALNQKVFHRVNERIGRPIRGSQRRAIMDKFKAGGSVYRIHAQYDEQRTMHERQGFNYDTTGKSKKIFKKIKAEADAETLLSPNVNLGILQLHDKLADEINNEGIIKGALQIVQFRPFCIVAFTEASIRLYDAIVSYPDSVLSWDATGGIVKNCSAKQCLYYELTISHPNVVNEDSLVPLTFMLSESQTLFTVTQWLLTFKECHRKVFPHKKDAFPTPAIILSDRAQIFLQAALRVFNDETYQQFLARAYRIVNNKAIRNDLSKTNIHACLSHFMLDMRKRVNRYLPEDIREVAMWSIALLVNTNTWPEMKQNWRLICQVFLSYSTDDNINFKQHHATLLSHISKITGDPNSCRAISQSKQILSSIDDPYEFDNNNKNDDYDDNHLHTNGKTKISNKKKQSISSRSHPSVTNKSLELNEADSPFKEELQTIYYECVEAYIKNYGDLSSSDKIRKGIRQWLSFINQRCIPTIPIWSNLLLGNLSRHGTSAIRAFDNLLLSTHDQRTNAISERRMSIVKRTQLGTQTRIRSDIVIEILIHDMKKMVEKFSISFMAIMFEDVNSETNSPRLKGVQERWRQSNRRGHGHYAKTPERSTMNNLKNALIISLSNINEDLLVPQLSVPNWLNASIGLLLSIKNVRETPSPSTIKTPLLLDMIHFIKNWISALDRLRPPKKTTAELTNLLNTQFHIPGNVSTDVTEQLSFIIHNILLPVIDHSLPVKKTYRCAYCKHTVDVRFNIKYVEISIVENQFRFMQQLANYFTDSTSDHLCGKCNMLTSRQIKISDCSPVIILKINDTSRTSIVFLQQLHTNTKDLIDNDSNLQHTQTISSSEQTTTTTAAASILLSQPVPVRLIDKSTNMSEHDTGSSDDEERINEITTVKKKKGNVVYQRASRPTTYDDDDDDDDDEDEFNRQIRLEETKKLQNEAEKTKTRVDPDGTVYEWDPNVKGWFPKVSEEFLVEHHMNYGLESSSGIRYDVHHQTYIQERDGMTYKLDKDTQQWIPLQSYTDEANNIKYTFSKKHNTWIPDVSIYSTNDPEGKQQTYVWLNDQLKWALLSTVDAYTDHITRIKYKWNNQTNSWDNEGIEPIEDEHDLPKEKKTIVPPPTQDEKKKPTEGWFELPDEKNCNVYISGLPLDITDEEFEELMLKYGIISPDPNDLRKKKIRLYRDEQGNPKGDGRCRYVRPESVKLCIDMLDETELRSSKIHVERAKFEVKGTFNPDLKRKRKKLDKKKKQLEVDKLLNWDERPEVIRHKYERIVVIKNMFDLQQFKNDPLFIDRLRNNIRESCSEYGEVKKINIYDGNPAGVATVGFTDIDQADVCCQYMNGRIWHGRVIQCQTWDGSTKYDVAEPEEYAKERIDEWHKYLNEDDDEKQT